MENTFSSKRFWLLVRKHANENRTIFLYSLIVMLIPGIYIHLNQRMPPETVFLSYVIFLVLIGGVYTGMFFKEWTYKARAVSLLILPATTLEKFALVLFYSVIVFIPVFTVFFYSSCFALSKIFNPGMPFSFIDQYRGLSTFPALILYAFLPYAFFQSLVLLFAICFKKRQTVRALEVIAILFIITTFWNMFYIGWLTGGPGGRVLVLNQFAFFPTVIEYDSSRTKITSLLITNVSMIILAISTMLFYIASYLKLKEKEI